MTKITLFLPIPVTVNHAYKNAGKRREKTANVKRWEWHAKHQLHTSGILKQYHAIVNRNRCLRDSCTVEMGKKIKVSIYELRKKFTQEYAVTYRFYFGDNQLRDVANFEKLLTDFLVNQCVLVDDQFISEMHMYRSGIADKNPRVEIEIISLDRTAQA